MTVHLMNSAVMPRPGVYTCARISEGEFFDAIVDAYHSLKLKITLATLKTNST
ncbi:MAG: hypothetical protein IPH16_16150 [Haliscomenobacter sp.]|nr:hypothetical protein [Haliscomenobacter sp.]